MIRDVTIGQYFPGSSLLHKTDARMKIIIIILLMVSVFLCRNYMSLGIAACLSVRLMLSTKIKPRVILKGLKPVVFIIILTALLNLFYGTGEIVFKFGFIKITDLGINNAVFMAGRILILVLFGLLLTYTTTPTSLTDALESLMKPLRIFGLDVHSVAMTMTIALRFIPTLVEEVDKIMSAQKSRGADMDSGGIVKRIIAVIPVMIPLFVSSFRRANELEYAMECRCYRGGYGRTKMNKMRLSARDYAFLAFTIAYFSGIVAMRVLMSNVI